jgi:hypothetical protein
MRSTHHPRYVRHRFPAEVISHAVWLYFRLPLSLRMVEEMLAARGILVSHETVRQGARHRQVSGKGRDDPRFNAGSGKPLGAGYLSPGVKRPRTATAMVSGTGVGWTAEEVCNLIMDRGKTLGLPD